MNIFIQKNHQLVEFNDIDWLKEHHTYRYGNLEKYIFESINEPKCNLCGSPLVFQKKGKYIDILTCSNENCDVCKGKHGDTKLKAFLPEYILNTIKSKRTHTNYYDKNYLINKKGMSDKEADTYIKLLKNNISERTKGHNKQYFLNKFGDSYNIQLRERNRLCIEYWIKRGYTEEEAKLNISSLQKYANSCVKNHHTLSYDDFENKEDALLFFKSRSQYCPEFWLKRGYTYNDAIKHVSELQTKCAQKFIEIYKKDPQKYKHLFNTTKEYWIAKGYTEDEAKQLQSERQRTFSKDICIKKYGEKAGLIVFNNRQKKWQQTIHNRYKDGIVLSSFKTYSDISQDLFNKILKFYNENNKDYVFYETKNKEYFLLRENKSYYFYDFTDLNQRKMIEFNGDVFHANPNIFNETDTPHPYYKNLTSKDIWEKDQQKINFAIKHNFDVLIVWEKDYRENQKDVLEKCKQFLNLN